MMLCEVNFDFSEVGEKVPNRSNIVISVLFGFSNYFLCERTQGM